MTELKFFHKVLIVIAIILVFSKLATMKFSQLLPHRKPQYTVVRYMPPVGEPERRTVVREYVPDRGYTGVPIPQSVYSNQIREPVMESPPRCAVVMENTTPDVSTGSVHIDDETFRRYFG